MALPVAVAPAPSSSSNSRPRRKKAYPLLDLHQRVKTPMNSIPNPPPPNPRIPKTPESRPPFCAAAAASSAEPVLLAGAAPATESSSALPGADAVGDPGDSTWSGARFRSVSRQVKSGGGDARFFDPRGAALSPWAASGEVRTKRTATGTGASRRPRRRSSGESPPWRVPEARVSSRLVSPSASFPPLEREEFFRLLGFFFCPPEMVLLSFFGVNERRGEEGPLIRFFRFLFLRDAVVIYETVPLLL